MLKLDYIDPDVSLSEMIKVHPVTCERATEKGYGIETTDELPFAPSKLALNSTENAFILYGERGIFVGNFASDLRNMDHQNQDQKDLERAPTDAALECCMVAADELEDDENKSVLQAEFCL